MPHIGQMPRIGAKFPCQIPHQSPTFPQWGPPGTNIDRCIIMGDMGVARISNETLIKHRGLNTRSTPHAHVLDTTLKWRGVSKVCIIMGDMEVARVSKETLIKHTD